MSIYERQPNPELEPDKQVFVDLKDGIMFAVNEAFEKTLEQYSEIDGNDQLKMTAEIIKFDDHLFDEKVFSILLAEATENSLRVAEKIRIFAYPSQQFETIRQSSQSLLSDSGVSPYETSVFFIDHQIQTGDHRYSRVDEDGIYPWVPKLRDIQLQENSFLLEDLDLILPNKESATPEQHNGAYIIRHQLSQLDKAYALELIAKIGSWPLTSQN